MRRTERDALLDGVPGIRELAAESLHRILFDGLRRQVLSFENHRRTERIAHDEIGGTGTLDRAVLLGGEALTPGRMLCPQHAGERDVEGSLVVGRGHVVWLSMFGHWPSAPSIATASRAEQASSINCSASQSFS